jgi:hypothetical protein
MKMDQNLVHYLPMDFACIVYLFEQYSMSKPIHLKMFIEKTFQSKNVLLPARLSGIETTPRVTPNRADSKNP